VKKIVRGRTKPAVGNIAKKRQPVTKPEIINRLHPIAKSIKQRDHGQRTQAPGRVAKGTGIMPTDLERAAREQENQLALAGRPAASKRKS